MGAALGWLGHEFLGLLRALLVSACWLFVFRFAVRRSRRLGALTGLMGRLSEAQPSYAVGTLLAICLAGLLDLVALLALTGAPASGPVTVGLVAAGLLATLLARAMVRHGRRLDTGT